VGAPSASGMPATTRRQRWRQARSERGATTSQPCLTDLP
jgi:hypothetical protein